jgi:hypothetical protein
VEINTRGQASLKISDAFLTALRSQGLPHSVASRSISLALFAISFSWISAITAWPMRTHAEKCVGFLENLFYCAEFYGG